MQSKSISRKRAINLGETDLALKAGVGFPSSRYFQIHFEYLQEQLHQTRDALQALQSQMQQLQQQLPIEQTQFGLSALEGLPVSNHHSSMKALTTKPKQR